MRSSVLGLFVVFVIFLIGVPVLQSSVIAQNTQGNSFQNTTPTMINGVVAHSLTASEASNLSSYGIWVSSDVSLDNSSNWHSIYILAKEYHLSLIGILDPYTMNFNNNTANITDWGNTVRYTVGNFSDVVSVWEIWNEPTNNDSSCGTFFTYGNAAQYVDLMKVAYQIIKATNPNVIVLGLGGLPLNADNSTMQDAFNFAQNVKNDTGMNYCDAISLHAYPNFHYSDYVANAYISSINEYTQITGKDVWITETGQESGNDTGIQYNQTEQANYLSTSYALFKSLNVKAYFWYELNDNNPGDSSDNSNSSTFGLYDVNYNNKTAFGTYFSLVNSETTPLVAAVNYLLENYNSTVGLIPEVPYGNTYWLYSDNFLASLALERYNSQYPGNSTIANTAKNIEGNFSYYIAGTTLLNQYMVMNSTNAAFNPSIFNNASSNTLFNYTEGSKAGAVINITLNNGPSALNSTQYADIAFLEAIYSNYTNHANYATYTYDNYTIGSKMFRNGIGLNDSVFQTGKQKGQYQTYKLALYIYDSKVLGYPVNQTAEADLLKMQGTPGGFYTGYDANFSNNGTSTNTETTSLAILALLPTPTPTASPTQTPTSSPSQSPSSTPTVPEFPSAIIVAILLIVTTTTILFSKRQKTDKVNNQFSTAYRALYRRLALTIH